MIATKTLQELFTYDSKVGALRWKNNHGNAAHAGDIAGGLHVKSNRWRISINKTTYQRSYLVWLYHDHPMPKAELDHKNRDSSDDHIENLRKATRSQQLANRGQMSNNTSGFRGVYYDSRKKRWAARISIFGKRKRLGTYLTAAEAFKVINQAGKEAYGEYWFA